MKKSKGILNWALFAFCISITMSSCMYKTVGGVKYVEKPNKVDDINIRYDAASEYAYGESIPFGIEMIAKRKMKRTTGYLGGNLSWNNFIIDVEGASLQDGKIILPTDKEKLPGGEVTLKVRLKGNRAVKDSETIILKNIERLELKYDERESVLGPRGKVDLGIVSFFDNHSQAETKGYLKGNKNWDNYRVEIEGGTFKNGTLTIGFPDNHKVKVRASLLTHPGIYSELEIPLDYKGKYTTYYDGRDGRNGRVGSNGRTGRNGRRYSGVGGNGGHGYNGGHGQDGDDGRMGEDGEDVDVYVSAEENAELGTTIISVMSVGRNSGKRSLAKFTPEGGSFMIYARGGDGGNGGNGGYGGRGGHGGFGDKKRETTNKNGTVTVTCGNGGNGGHSGNGGDGGDGGRGGDGGTITFHIDPSAAPYQYLIRYDVRGGRSGDSGTAGVSYNPGEGGQGGCSNGRDGRRGRTGNRGFRGRDGAEGNTPKYIVEPVDIDWSKGGHA